MKIELIAAVAANGVLDFGSWIVPEHASRVNDLTFQRVTLMGRKTYEATRHIANRPPNLIVVSRTLDHAKEPPGVHVVPSITRAITRAALLGAGSLFVVGGLQVFESLYDDADRLHLTRVRAVPSGWRLWPGMPEREKKWRSVAETEHESSNGTHFTRQTFQRVGW